MPKYLSAGINKGFKQQPFHLPNQFTSDPFLHELISHFLPDDISNSIVPDLIRLGDLVVSPRIMELVEDAENSAAADKIPYIKHYDIFTNKTNKLITSFGWKELKNVGIKEGLLSIAYKRDQGIYSRFYHMIKYFLYSTSSAMVCAPLSMTDGCARALELDQQINKRDEINPVYYRVTSNDPDYAWINSQWTTERTGGSDISNTETFAFKSDSIVKIDDSEQNEQNVLADYKIDGFKCFASTVDCQVALILARDTTLPNSKTITLKTKKSIDQYKVPPIGCFLGHIHPDNDTVILSRLKKKWGTKAFPTAELELKGLKAQSIGLKGEGVKTIVPVLNITRLHSAFASVSNFHRALQIAKNYSLQRYVAGKTLSENPLHLKTLAQEESKLHGLLIINCHTSVLLGIDECTPNVDKDTKNLLKILPTLAKEISSKLSVSGCSECMEALGGIGYLTHDIEMNIGRLIADCQVNTIWEGTTNVLSRYVVSTLQYKIPIRNSFIKFLRSSNNNSAKDTIDEYQNFINDKVNELLGKENQKILNIPIEYSRDFTLQLSAIVILKLLVNLTKSNIIKRNSNNFKSNFGLNYKIVVENNFTTLEYWIDYIKTFKTLSIEKDDVSVNTNISNSTSKNYQLLFPDINKFSKGNGHGTSRL